MNFDKFAIVDVYQNETHKGRAIYRGTIISHTPTKMNGTAYALVKGPSSTIWTDIKRLKNVDRH